MQQLALTALMSFVAAIIFTWIVRRVALTLNIVDRPDAIRKLHARPVPLWGGIAVCAAWTIGLATNPITVQERPPGSSAITNESGTALSAAAHSNPDNFRAALFLAAAVILIAGMLDDIYGLRARYKLIAQVCAACALVGNGLVVERISLFGSTWSLGWLGFAFTVFWLTGAMNAVNMLDGLDGLATTLGVVMCLTLAVITCLGQAYSLAMISLALAASLGGFLLFNFPPARIFLGDAGSNLIGLVIGAVALKASLTRPGTAAMAAPVLLLCIPIFDGFAAVIRRRLTMMAITAPDRGHIHHCLQRRGWSDLRVLASLTALCAFTGASVMASLLYGSESIAISVALTVVIGCVITKFFGYYEFQLVRQQTALCWRRLWKGRRGEITPGQSHSATISPVANDIPRRISA